MGNSLEDDRILCHLHHFYFHTFSVIKPRYLLELFFGVGSDVLKSK